LVKSSGPTGIISNRYLVIVQYSQCSSVVWISNFITVHMHTKGSWCQ